jgi:hypothetical protein
LPEIVSERARERESEKARERDQKKDGEKVRARETMREQCFCCLTHVIKNFTRVGLPEFVSERERKRERERERDQKKKAKK